MMDKLLSCIDRLRATRVRQTSRYWKATADLPAALYPFWKRTAQFEFKGIPQDAFFFARATEGLLTFFDCVRTSRTPCGLPSAAADSVWHAWARMAPKELDAFCVKHFGRVIAHVEAVGMGAGMESALVSALVTARVLEGREPDRPSVPRLFALDRNLAMPGGFGYELVRGEVACRRLGNQGRPEGELFYPVGLSDPVDLRKAKSKRAGGGCGGGCGSSCGCHCGGGCGGGCGGD